MPETQTRALEKGFEYFENKQYALAEAEYRAALDTQAPDHIEIKFRLAFCLEMQDKCNEAESFYNQVETSGGPPAIVGDALYRIAWMAMTHKDHVKAIKYYTKALGILKDSPNSRRIYKDCIYWMALSYEVVGRVIKALDIYEQIAIDDFWFWDVCYRKIKCFDKIGRYQDALSCCQEFAARYQTKSDLKRAKELYPGIIKIKDQLEALLLT
ncbi:MAG: tetratricopeptide repeat protein [Proteobacteria bacterium]|nr:tetratricopeptide repeat protein [Pseudomonadota bacterium]